MLYGSGVAFDKSPKIIKDSLSPKQTLPVQLGSFDDNNVPTARLLLRPILTVTSVWNTGETGDMNGSIVWMSGIQIVTVHESAM